MAAPDRDNILNSLNELQDPDLGQGLVDLDMIRDLQIDEGVQLRLVLMTPASPLREGLVRDIKEKLAGLGISDPKIEVDAEVPRAAQPASNSPMADRLPGVKAVLCIASGKGGVGKSTVASNVAIALSQLGCKVGLLDADIYGPSMPTMLGLTEARPQATADGQGIEPLERYGVKVMSMGFMMKQEDAVIWRGPMLGKALQQFIEDVAWGELDYLVLDMPPGTGDVQLSLSQLLPVAGAVVVTTPQDVAFADVRRAIKMFETTRTHVLGLVENMSHFTCGQCGANHAIFGDGNIEQHAADHSLEVLGRLPLDSVTAVAADQGQPISVAAPDSSMGQAYRELAQTVARKLALRAVTASRPAFENFFQMKQA